VILGVAYAVDGAGLPAGSENGLYCGETPAQPDCNVTAGLCSGGFTPPGFAFVRRSSSVSNGKMAT
jgi:hypothetical protein